jgi:hypothetical protein
MDARRASSGATFLVAGALAGAVVAVINYFMPDNGIAGTPGAALVVGSSLALALTGLPLRRRAGVCMLLVAAVLVAGTAFAAWLLESRLLVVAMAVAALGWMMLVLRRNRRVA